MCRSSEYHLAIFEFSDSGITHPLAWSRSLQRGSNNCPELQTMKSRELQPSKRVRVFNRSVLGNADSSRVGKCTFDATGIDSGRCIDISLARGNREVSERSRGHQGQVHDCGLSRLGARPTVHVVAYNSRSACVPAQSHRMPLDASSHNGHCRR